MFYISNLSLLLQIRYKLSGRICMLEIGKLKKETKDNRETQKVWAWSHLAESSGGLRSLMWGAMTSHTYSLAACLQSCGFWPNGDSQWLRRPQIDKKVFEIFLDETQLEPASLKLNQRHLLTVCWATGLIYRDWNWDN